MCSAKHPELFRVQDDLIHCHFHLTAIATVGALLWCARPARVIRAGCSPLSRLHCRYGAPENLAP